MQKRKNKVVKVMWGRFNKENELEGLYPDKQDEERLFIWAWPKPLDCNSPSRSNL